MANNYYNMTGVLVLDKVTPVIKALFGVYNLDENYPGNGTAYIANVSKGTSCDWDSVLENLVELAENLGLELVDENRNPADSIEEVLSVLARHFNADQNEELANFIEHNDFENDADLDSLQTIAKLFDDGHGLKAYKVESSWYCSKPRLFEFGGCGAFSGSHVAVSGTSGNFVTLGETLESAIETGDIEAAANALSSSIGTLLAGIYDDDTRAQVRRKLMERLYF